MFKKLLGKGKCLLGFHEGDWEYERAEKCGQTRLCARCGTQQTRTEHQWADWRFDQPRHCAQTRICARCSESEQRVQHEWGAARYAKADSCDQICSCDRCGETKASGTAHQWHGWEYATADSCGQQQTCTRCGARSAVGRVAHQWGEWQHSAQHGGAVRVCRRCGEMEIPVRSETAPAAAPAARTAIDISDASVANLLRRAGISEEPASAPRAPAQEPLDPRLAGHWRHTHCMSSGGFSMVTDTHWILEGDGRFAEYSHQASGMGENTSAPSNGRWHATNGVLHVQLEIGGASEHPYHLEADQLFLPQEGHFRLWERV